MPGRSRRKDRDLDRLAYLERLSRGAPARAPEAAGGRKEPAVTGFARYARFRQAAALIFTLALLAVLWGALSVVLEVVAYLRADRTLVEGLGRVVAWFFATTVGYGVLKGLGEAILIWADLAELSNSQAEYLYRWQQERRSSEADHGA